MIFIFIIAQNAKKTYVPYVKMSIQIMELLNMMTRFKILMQLKMKI